MDPRTSAASAPPPFWTGADKALLRLTAKVADFGLSLPLAPGATHASQKFQGTPDYLAPEVSGKRSCKEG